MAEEELGPKAEEERCPAADEYNEWYLSEFIPELLKFSEHIVNCPKCQREVLLAKDSTAFEMLTMSEEGFMQRLRDLTDLKE